MFPGSQIVASLKTRLWYKVSAQCHQRHITLKGKTLFQCWGFYGITYIERWASAYGSIEPALYCHVNEWL